MSTLVVHPAEITTTTTTAPTQNRAITKTQQITTTEKIKAFFKTLLELITNFFTKLFSKTTSEQTIENISLIEPEVAAPEVLPPLQIAQEHAVKKPKPRAINYRGFFATAATLGTVLILVGVLGYSYRTAPSSER